jgi:hypothetical protein
MLGYDALGTFPLATLDDGVIVIVINRVAYVAAELPARRGRPFDPALFAAPAAADPPPFLALRRSLIVVEEPRRRLIVPVAVLFPDVQAPAFPVELLVRRVPGWMRDPARPLVVGWQTVIVAEGAAAADPFPVELLRAPRPVGARVEPTPPIRVLILPIEGASHGSPRSSLHRPLRTIRHYPRSHGGGQSRSPSASCASPHGLPRSRRPPWSTIRRWHRLVPVASSARPSGSGSRAPGRRCRRRRRASICRLSCCGQHGAVRQFQRSVGCSAAGSIQPCMAVNQPDPWRCRCSSRIAVGPGMAFWISRVSGISWLTNRACATRHRSSPKVSKQVEDQSGPKLNAEDTE